MKNLFNEGDKIKIIQMIGEPDYIGREGIITHIDDFGQLHGTWGGLAIIPQSDEIEIIKKGEIYNEKINDSNKK